MLPFYTARRKRNIPIRTTHPSRALVLGILNEVSQASLYHYIHKVCLFSCLEQAMYDVRDQMLDVFLEGIQFLLLFAPELKERWMDGHRAKFNKR